MTEVRDLEAEIAAALEERTAIEAQQQQLRIQWGAAQAKLVGLQREHRRLTAAPPIRRGTRDPESGMRVLGG